MKDREALPGLNLRTVIDTIPAALFIIDHDTRILDLNDSAAKLINKSSKEVILHLCGDILHCTHAINAPNGCGTTKFCCDCMIRNTVIDCCSGQQIVRRKAELLKEKDNVKTRVIFLISASPFKNKDIPLALVSMEDITEIVLLRKLVPICSYCKSIRKDNEFWESIEEYLHQQNGAHLSHGICPDCAKKFYPDLNIYDE